MSTGFRFALRALFAAVLTLLWLGLSLAIVGMFYKPNTQIPEDLPGKTLTVQGLPLRVLQSRQGEGRDILLIHGSPGSIEDWAPLMRMLQGSYRVTAYDRPGHGWSGDSGKYSFSANADTALALIEQLNLHDVIVVGHSYGGATALALALRAPERVSAYVVLDSAVYTPSRQPEPLHQLLSWPRVGVGSASVIGTFLAPVLIRRGLTQVFGSHGPGPAEDFIALRTRIWSTPKVMHAAATETLQAAAGLAAQSPRYHEIQRPLAILAQADEPLRRASAERLHAEVASSTLLLLRGTGHYLQFERTRDVADAIVTVADATRVPDETLNSQ